MTLCCYTSILLALHCAQASLLWTVDQKIAQYGENLTLLCHVPNCCPNFAGWSIVDRDGIDHTLFTDIKSHKKKYDGEVKTNGYTLIIRNLTKQDLNVSYKCVYRNIFGDPLRLLEKDVFKECIPCPDGTYRNGSGCGPCRHFQKSSQESFVPHKKPSGTIETDTSKSIRLITEIISSSTFLPLQVNPHKSGEKENILIIFIVILVALVILLSVVTIAICVKRSGFVLAGICWTHGNVQPADEDLRQNDVELGEALLKHEIENANIELMKDTGNNVAEYQTKETFHQCPTFSPKPEEPRESVDSGCHEENISDIVVNNMYADHKSSSDSVFCKDNTDMYESKQQDKNTKDSLTFSVSSMNDETKSEHDSGKNIPKLSIDFSGINNNTNNNLNLSATCCPVTVNSEPHTFQLFTANVQGHQGDTSGFQTQSEQGHQGDTSGYQTRSDQDARPSTSSQSGEYMSMNVSTLNSRRDTSETIPSNFENYYFKIKGNNSNSISGKSETDMKHAGPKSVDSGVYNI